MTSYLRVTLLSILVHTTQTALIIPDFGFAMGNAIESGDAEFGVLVCGSGIGISIAANRNPVVRAAVVSNSLTAKLARQHNDANVICFGERFDWLRSRARCHADVS